MRSLPFPLVRHGFAAVCLASVAVVGGCSSRDFVPTGGADYRQTHPISAELRSFAVVVPLSETTEDSVALPADFLADYHRRGRGPMTILVPSQAGGAGRRAAEHLAAALDRRLIQTKAAWSAEGSPADRADGALTVVYTAYVAVVPTCGDWSGEAGFNPSSLPHTNYGCSVQRNVGMMLADPGDLVASGLSGRVDAAWSADVIENFRQGEPTGRQRPIEERGTSSAVGE